MRMENEIKELAKDLLFHDSIVLNIDKREMLWNISCRRDQYIKTATYIYGLGYRLTKSDHKDGDLAYGCYDVTHKACNHCGTALLCSGEGNPVKYHNFKYNNYGFGICKFCQAQVKCEHMVFKVISFSFSSLKECLNCGFICNLK